MTSKPQSYLPPQAQPWGRYIENTIADLQLKTGIIGNGSENNLRQLNSSVNLLSAQQKNLQAQQDYLATFQSYTSTDSSSVATTTMGSIVSLRNLSVTFTLTRAASVLVNINANGYSYADHNSTTPMPTLRFGTSLMRGSTSYPSFLNTYGGTMGLFGNFSGTGRAGYEGALFGAGIVPLSAGTHTLTAYWTVYMYGNSGYANVTNASIVATVVG